MSNASLPWLELDEFRFHHVLPTLPGATLVLFGQPHCGACRVWHARLPRLVPPRIRQLCYVDIAVSSALAHEFELFHLPALALYDNGAFHTMVNAPLEREKLAEAIQIALASPPSEAP
ncbi:thioredoxin domain-containing protein [Pseudogulbenkiania subflava]|uniref:Thioredoxin n=1 Tax=Pseudogulbenkiania subflava DSM 22618 TaxID=1123014 RepID=A0A1Y6BQZ6_9NEIS|nr:thioredoxin domain-containing protein [Pseudogulbenkiania subflava]SMF24573.1 Thioredoxin [Pseudogulbenkiania subflava DSM 22618]